MMNGKKKKMINKIIILFYNMDKLEEFNRETNILISIPLDERIYKVCSKTYSASSNFNRLNDVINIIKSWEQRINNQSYDIEIKVYKDKQLIDYKNLLKII